MRYVHLRTADNGDSEFVESELPGKDRHVIDGVPPLKIAGPYDVSRIEFVQSTAAVADWQHHVAPRSQWLLILSGQVAITVTNGERREFGPGDVILIEDTTGTGHLSTPLTDDFTFAMIHTGS